MLAQLVDLLALRSQVLLEAGLGRRRARQAGAGGGEVVAGARELGGLEAEQLLGKGGPLGTELGEGGLYGRGGEFFLWGKGRR